MRTEDQAVLATGSNSGIGFATARRLIEEGAKVGITGRNEETLCASTRPRLKTLTVSEPPKRRAGVNVPDVRTLVERLKTEAKVL